MPDEEAVRRAVSPHGLAEVGRLAAAAVPEAGEEQDMISESDRTRIADAIRKAEAQTDGEIFCVIAKHLSKDHQHHIIWAAAIALFVPLPLIYLTKWSAPVDYLVQLTIFLVMAMALSYPKLKFHVVPRTAKRARAHAEAMRLFFSKGLDKTEHRTGVLIFASAAERYAEIVADSGINKNVTKDVWDDAVNALVTAIKAGHPADGFVAAIEKCGVVLATHVPPGSLKRDELPDKIFEI